MDFIGARAEGGVPVRRLSAKASTVTEDNLWESDSGGGQQRLPGLEAELTWSQCTEPEGNGKKEAVS